MSSSGTARTQTCSATHESAASTSSDPSGCSASVAWRDPCPGAQVARTALELGHRLLMSAINDEPFDVAAAVARVAQETGLARETIDPAASEMRCRDLVYEGGRPFVDPFKA